MIASAVPKRVVSRMTAAPPSRSFRRALSCREETTKNNPPPDTLNVRENNGKDPFIKRVADTLGNIWDHPKLDFDKLMKISTRESDKVYCVDADLPGLSKDDIDVHLEGNYVVIRGERKDVHEGDGGWSTGLREVEYGRVERAVPLPRDAEYESTTATMKNGVLRLVMQKKPTMQPKMTIPVEDVF